MQGITSIFSEDFRNEADGKHSLIGVYGNRLNVSSKTELLPKLSITVYIRIPLNSKIDSLFTHVKVNGKVVTTKEVPEGFLQLALQKSKELGEPLLDIAVNNNLAFFYLPKEENMVEVEVLLNGKSVHTGILRIVKSDKIPD